jgi:hypothetical protein
MRKIIILAAFLVLTTISYAQSLGYQNLALLFSEDNANTTARVAAMSGAFGALGGDISVMNINPAGLAFYNNSYFSGSFNSRNTAIESNYYGNSAGNENQFFNIAQAGAVLVFKSAYASDWSKFVLGINYQVTKDFTNSFNASGNSGVATFTSYPLDANETALNYNEAQGQRFTNEYSGDKTEINIAFSSIHKEKLYVGASLNFYNLDFGQKSTLVEFNNDTDGNELDASLHQQNRTTGGGFSLNAGFIYKAHKNFRFGLSYQTPTVFAEVLEETNIVDNDGFMGDTEIFVSEDSEFTYSNNVDEYGDNFFPSQRFMYSLKTPSKLTASAAFIFGKRGLLSLDYINKRYQNIRLSNSDFSAENQFFQNGLRNTHALNIGTEWRFESFSVRGGYNFAQAPIAVALDSDSLRGYSFGGGYNFGKFKLDVAYSNNNRTSFYNAYPQFPSINSIELQTDNRIFTTTLTIGL